ncbi:MAG: CotH kinase family protein [Candidatus Marinimicrobia bacterium]|nr:CotH kinase family protein [Candidatus Neomarinimicrobiota bacterium]
MLLNFDSTFSYEVHYDDSELAVVEITVDPDDLTWMYNHVESDSLHPASIHFSNAYIDESVDLVGFRLRGNTSRNADKKSFKLDFNHFVSGREFYDVEKMNLNGEHNDPSIIRSKLSWDYYQSIGVVSSRASHVKVYINGDYYGLYISIEHIDDTFLKRNYENDSGNLWKCIWPADLTYRGDDPENYHPYHDDERPYNLKTNKDEWNYSKLARLISIIHQSPDSLEMVLDVKEALQYFAVNVLTGSWDDYRFLRNNYYLYHNPEEDLIHWIPYDYDNSFSIDWFDIDWATIDPYSYAVIDSDGRPLTEYLFSQDRYKNLFTHFIEFYINTSFNNAEWNDLLDTWRFALMAAADDDQWRTMDYGFTMWDFNASYGYDYQNQHTKKGIKAFIADRVSSLNDQLYYSGEEPFIYEVIPSHRSIILNDTLTISASVFGPIGVDDVIFHYRVNSNDWITTSLNYNPIENTKIVEENDRWDGMVTMDSEGEAEWYLTAIKNGDVERFPTYGYKILTILNPNDANGILINELLAKNDDVIVDEYGEYDDWIEIVNFGENPVELDGYYLTDNSSNFTKWSFPISNIVIEPNEYLIVWTDNDDEQGDLHTNFKLSASGEFIALVSPDGSTIIDSITFGQQTADISFGRVETDQDVWDFLTPTPGTINQSLNTIESSILALNPKLGLPYPNPFNPIVDIPFFINKKEHIQLSIINILGEHIIDLVNENKNIGTYNIQWNGSNNMNEICPSGIYFIILETESIVNSTKLVLLQ